MVLTVNNILRWKRRGPIFRNTVTQNKTNWPMIKVTRRVTQLQKISNHPTNRIKNPPHRYWQKSSQRKPSWVAETTGGVLQPLCKITITSATWRSTHKSVWLAFKIWQPGTIQGQTCAFRSCIVKSSTTGYGYHRTRSQLKPDTAFSDHANTKGPPENHLMPNHQERGQLGGQPGQPVQLANDVAIMRSWPIPVVSLPDPTTMAKAGHGHGYVTRSERVVKRNIILT